MGPVRRRTQRRTAPEASRLLEALRLLVHNRCHAGTKGLSPWQYAIQISTLEAAGLSESALKWMVEHRYVDYAADCTQPGKQQRKFRKPSRGAFDRRTCFILTQAGARLADRMLGERDQPSGAAAERPRWDAKRRELKVGDTLVRRFLREAPRQERILTAFEERGWPERIADPFPADPDVLAKDRLHNTIKNLNAGLENLSLHFAGDGTGTGIRWELRPAELVHDDPTRGSRELSEKR